MGHADQAVANRPNPEHSIGIEIETGNIVAGKALGFLEGGHLAAAQQIQPALFRAHPDVAARIIGDGTDYIAGEAFIGRVDLPICPVPTTQPALCSNPKPAIMSLIKSGNLRIQNSHSGRRPEFVALQTK